jgi:alpha-beta hydrolase superfamily lysophospholipase
MKLFLKKAAYIFLFLFIFFNIICAVQAYHFTRFVDNVSRQNPAEMGFFSKAGYVLFGAPVPKSKVVDSLHIPHESAKIITEDNLHLAAWSTLNNNAVAARGTVIMFHGHGSCRSGLTKEAEAFYYLGWNILTVDFRDHGESEGTTCSVGYNEAKDVKAAYDYAVASGAKNIVLYGTSMGAASITKAIHDYSTIQPIKIILEMPFGTMHNAAQGFVRLMKLPDEPLGTLLTFWGGADLGIWAFSNKPVEYVKDVHCKILLQWGQEDLRVTGTETKSIYNNLGTKDKKLVIYENSGHESLCKNEHDKWIQNIAVFLNN